MQDVQNIPNPDVNSIEDDGDFGSHSDEDSNTPNSDVESPRGENPNDRIQNAPIEEPPPEDKSGEPKRIL